MFHNLKLVSLIRFGEEEQKPEFDVDAALKHPAIIEYAERLASERVGGMLKKNGELLNELKDAKGSLKTMQSGIEDEEDLKALKSGQVDFKTLADKRVQANNLEWQARHDAVIAERDAERKASAEIQAQLKRFNIESRVADAAAKNQFVNPKAIKDIKRLAGDIFDMDEKGNIYARDKNGNVMLDKRGAPLAFDSWLEILPEEYEHYFLPQAGSGSKSGQGSGKVYSLKQFQDAVAAAPNIAEQQALLKKRAAGEITIHG
ncbi:hypothetical protein [Pseudomonas aeruginosa]|uniref:hypothetical protein n=1 Tax=Pseudomonas aeruginosa TaxID=287 RepID=UPI0032E530D3